MNIEKFVKDYAPVALGREITQEELDTVVALAFEKAGFAYDGLQVDLDGVYIDKTLPKKELVEPTPALKILSGLFIKFGVLQTVKRTAALLELLSQKKHNSNGMGTASCC